MSDVPFFDPLNFLASASPSESTEEAQNDQGPTEEEVKAEDEARVAAFENEGGVDILEATYEQETYLDVLHHELAVLADGRTEDNIGLNDPYWAKRNQLQAYIHNLKG